MDGGQQDCFIFQKYTLRTNISKETLDKPPHDWMGTGWAVCFQLEDFPSRCTGEWDFCSDTATMTSQEPFSKHWPPPVLCMYFPALSILCSQLLPSHHLLIPTSKLFFRKADLLDLAPSGMCVFFKLFLTLFLPLQKKMLTFFLKQKPPPMPATFSSSKASLHQLFCLLDISNLLRWLLPLILQTSCRSTYYP